MSGTQIVFLAGVFCGLGVLTIVLLLIDEWHEVKLRDAKRDEVQGAYRDAQSDQMDRQRIELAAIMRDPRR